MKNVMWKKASENAWEMMRKDGKGEPLAEVVDDPSWGGACFRWIGEDEIIWYGSVERAMCHPKDEEIETRLRGA